MSDEDLLDRVITSSRNTHAVRSPCYSFATRFQAALQAAGILDVTILLTRVAGGHGSDCSGANHLNVGSPDRRTVFSFGPPRRVCEKKQPIQLTSYDYEAARPFCSFETGKLPRPMRSRDMSGLRCWGEADKANRSQSMLPAPRDASPPLIHHHCPNNARLVATSRAFR
jgi:hypothetical protein